uniref:Uncharacterized protein n=1 Tax=Arundo donax TaxID=35708 RepID=A0A0A9BK42_ARUDO
MQLAICLVSVFIPNLDSLVHSTKLIS